MLHSSNDSDSDQPDASSVGLNMEQEDNDRREENRSQLQVYHDWLLSGPRFILNSQDDMNIAHNVEEKIIEADHPGNYRMIVDSLIEETNTECKISIEIKCNVIESPSANENVTEEDCSSSDSSVIYLGTGSKVDKKGNSSDNLQIKEEILIPSEDDLLYLKKGSQSEGNEPSEIMKDCEKRHRPSGGNIILSEGLKFARTPPGIEELKAKFFTQAKQLFSATNKEVFAAASLERLLVPSVTSFSGKFETSDDNFSNKFVLKSVYEGEPECPEFKLEDKAKRTQERLVDPDSPNEEHTAKESSVWKQSLNLNIIGKQASSPEKKRII